MKLLLTLLLAEVLLSACGMPLFLSAPPTPAPTLTLAPSPIPLTATPTPVPLVQTYLANLQPAATNIGFWTLGVGVFPGSERGMEAGKVIESHGRTFAHGLFAHAPSSLVYSLGGQYMTFTSDILLKDTACSQGVMFDVSLDDVEIFRSGNILPSDPPQHIELDVTGGGMLKLDTLPGDSNACDWSIWGDPYLLSLPGAVATPSP